MKDELTQTQWEAQQEQEFTEIIYCLECGERLEEPGDDCITCCTISPSFVVLYQCSLCLEEHEDEICNCYE